MKKIKEWWVRQWSKIKAWFSPAPKPKPDVPAQPPAVQPPAVVTGPYTSQDHNFLWKPVGEGNRPAGVLFPAWLDVDYMTAKGEKVRPYRRSNDNRPTCRMSRQGTVYGKNFDVVATMKDGIQKVWRIWNGARRQEERHDAPA